MGCCSSSRRPRQVEGGSNHSYHNTDRPTRTGFSQHPHHHQHGLSREAIMARNLTHSVHQVLDKKDFVEQLAEAGSKLVIVDFFATWCGPCKVIGPEVEKLAESMPDVVFLKVDVDQVEELATEYNISCMPTFLAFKNGERIGDMSGANLNNLKKFINERNTN